jgi:superoxide dismutase
MNFLLSSPFQQQQQLQQQLTEQNKDESPSTELESAIDGALGSVHELRAQLQETAILQVKLIL